MPQSDLFLAFTDQVVSHVRCRFVRAAIASELAAHMEDHAAALYEQGTDVVEARRLAVEAMGDPIAVGKDLDKLYPPVLYWLVRILGCAAAGLLAAVLILISGRIWVNSWHEIPLFPNSTPVEVLNRKVLASPWNQSVIATGYVTGGGTLGDYTFAPLTGAQLVYSPEAVWDGVTMESYYSLQFILGAEHAQPWLGGVDLTWTAPAMTDGEGNTATIYDEGFALQATSYSVSPFQDYIVVSLTPFDPTEDSYTFSFTSADGTALTFTVTLTDWEVEP